MKFNKIIMNPPYMGSLHLEILSNTVRLLDDKESVIVNLSPSRWLQDSLARYKAGSDLVKFEGPICSHLTDFTNISGEEAQKYFNADIWTDLGIYTLKKDGTLDYKQIYKSKDSEFLDKVVIPVITGQAESIDKYLTPMGVCNFDTPFVRVSNLHGHQGKRDFYEFMTPQESIAFSKDASSCSRTFNVETEDEAKNFFKIIHNDFMRYLCKLTKGDMNVPWRYTPYLGKYTNPRTGLKGYLSEWTTEDLCNFYGLDDTAVTRMKEVVAKEKQK